MDMITAEKIHDKAAMNQSISLFFLNSTPMRKSTLKCQQLMSLHLIMSLRIDFLSLKFVGSQAIENTQVSLNAQDLYRALWTDQ